MGRRSVLIFTVVLTLQLFSSSADFSPVGTLNGNDDVAVFTVTFSRNNLLFGRLKGFDTIRMQDCGFLEVPGAPMLPSRTVRVALPPGMEATGVRLVETKSAVLDGRFRLYPEQPPQPFSRRVSPIEFTDPDLQIYGSPDPYPALSVEFLGQSDLAGQGIAAVRVSPLQYLPSQQNVIFLESITFALELREGYECGDYLPSTINQKGKLSYEQRIRDLVLNPVEVQLQTSPSMSSMTAMPGVDPGAFEYVIITQTDWVDDFQPLADWRVKTGIPTIIVTTNWIYNQGGYSGTHLEKVRAFVEDAHVNWGATHFLMGGDTNVIPYHIRTITVPGYWTDDIPNDTYYADYDEDWLCEIQTGRAPVRTGAQISTFVNKVLTYEKSPMMMNYVKTAAFLGFDINVDGDQHGESFKEYIRSLHLPTSWNLSTEYDSEPGLHKADVMSLLNQGSHIVNHHDHCNSTLMGVGSINHGELLEISDVNTLSNGNRQSILFAIGCFPCDIPTYSSIGESFIQRAGGGAVAYFGNSRYGWGGPTEDPDRYAMRQDRMFYESVFDMGVYRLGDCFSYLKNNAFDPDDPYNVHKYSFTQLYLLGEPEMLIWTENPDTINAVTYDELINAEGQQFYVSISNEGDLSGYTVCLWKENEIYEVRTTDSLGQASFPICPLSGGSMSVTVLKHNVIPWEGSCDVSQIARNLGLRPAI